MPLYNPVGDDGWFTSSDTWLWSSANSFTITGVNRTTQLTKGTRISWNDGTVQYGVVGAVTFSTNTTVTLIANNTYAIGNTTLTAPRYSYAANPQGYPTWFAWTPTLGNYSTPPSNTLYRFRVVGSECFIVMREATLGVSANGSAKTYSLPVNALTVTNAFWAGPAGVVDNNIVSTTLGLAYISSGATSLSVYVNPSTLSAWTTSGNARVSTASIAYQF